MAAGTVARAFIGIDLGYVALRLALCARETHLHGALLRWSGPSANRDSGSPGSEWGNRALQQNTDVLGAHTAVRRHPWQDRGASLHFRFETLLLAGLCIFRDTDCSDVDGVRII